MSKDCGLKIYSIHLHKFGFKDLFEEICCTKLSKYLKVELIHDSQHSRRSGCINSYHKE